MSDKDKADSRSDPNGLLDRSIVENLGTFDPATLYEAADQEGMVDPAIRPAWPGAKICGLALTVECPQGDNLMLHLAVAEAKPGLVIVADAGGYLRAGAWGEVLTVAAQARGVVGLVIDGAVRDVDAIEEHEFPVFSRGFAIGSCAKVRYGKLNIPISLGQATVHPGDIVVGNTDGLIIIKQNRAEEVYKAACRRRERELEIMEKLRQGQTTVELLGLPSLSAKQDNPKS